MLLDRAVPGGLLGLVLESIEPGDRSTSRSVSPSGSPW
jgi:hypothetical protein